MFRFGVVTREELLRAAAKRARVGPGVAFPLVAAFERPLSGEDERALAFLYGNIPAGRSIKLTWRSRLRPLDDLVLAEAERRFAPERTIRVHDMAASNAITSVELFERLAATGREVAFLASDFYDALKVVTLPGGRWRVVFDAEGGELQILGRRMVLAASGERKRFPVNRLVHAWARRWLVPRARTMLAEGRAQRLSLFHPDAMALADRDQRFRLGREDVFHPPAGPFEIVRVLSFLTEHRFTPETVRPGLAAAGATVAEGGLLVLGRTHGVTDRLEGSLLTKEKGRFVSLADIGEGYTFKDIVLGL